MKKLYTFAVLLMGTVSVNASVVLNFKTAVNTDSNNGEITVSLNPTGVVTASSSAGNAPGVSGTANTFTAGVSGTALNFKIEAFGRPDSTTDTTYDFVGSTWNGGTQSVNHISANATLGMGVSTDGLANGDIQRGEALVFTFDFSSLGLSADQAVVLKNVTFTKNDGNIWMRDSAVSAGTAGAGVQLAANVLSWTTELFLKDGDQLAFMRGSGDIRLESMEFDIITIPEAGTIGLFMLAGGGVFLSRKMIKR